jgi:hypothetical protein
VTSQVQIPLPTKIELLMKTLSVNPNSAKVLFDLSQALDENGDVEGSLESIRRAFAINPNACNALADPGAIPDAARGYRMRELAAALIADGLCSPPVIAALAVGESLCGNESAVRALVDYERFFRVTRMKAPEGFGDFHAALGREIRSDLKFYDEPRERAIRKGWRNNDTMHTALPASAAFTAAVRREVEAYMAALSPCPDHPFVASRPAAFSLTGWAVVSDGSSYHHSHIHPNAWMSCVYYVVRPQVSCEPGSDRGWLSVGPPEFEHLSPDQVRGWDSRLVEPEPGNLVLMPAYFFHRTRPMGVEEERICVAIDVIAGN